MRTFIALTLLLALASAYEKEAVKTPVLKEVAPPAYNTQKLPVVEKTEKKVETVKEQTGDLVKKKTIDNLIHKPQAESFVVLPEKTHYKPGVLDIPCDHRTLDVDMPRVVYIAAEEEDCTTELKAEVSDLQLLVDKLTLLLTAKGVKIGTGDKCHIPGQDTTTTTAPGTTGTGTTGNGNTGGQTNTGNANGSTGPSTSGPSSTGNANGEASTAASSGTEGTESSSGSFHGNSRNLVDEVSSSSAGAASSSLYVALGAIGASVVAGVAAVGVGAALGGSGASAAAPASMNPAAAAQQNPLYTADTAGSANSLFV